MRLLVACPQCKRQYDATQLGVGTRFHCRCGQILTVPEPQTHAAAAVCCSHCGAPRAEGALSCAYCGAEFSLHDRDLDTVCPHCFARVSHQARFCQFCGGVIHPEMSAGEMTQLICPACGDGHMLTSRALGDVSALECQRCAGMWLSHESFQQLTAEASKEGMHIDPRLTPSVARAPNVDAKPPDGGTHYRHCVICNQLMTRQNYGHSSSVIIDICGRHGVWLDADDLPRILEWVQEGGLVRQNEVSIVQQAADAAKAQAKAQVEAKLIERNLASAGGTDTDAFASSKIGRVMMLIGGFALLGLVAIMCINPESGWAQVCADMVSYTHRSSSHLHYSNTVLHQDHADVYIAAILLAIPGGMLIWYGWFGS